ncbi:flagellar assembly protein FliW [Nocardioides caldifontis]|uniref:flagellar assembly protein FliW n=1 Tax=Nocardioides caldifontis TaxID=2588938 RepID=UPI001EF11093|nr:flagellar assembly protein FliW [Nocardioides caldifontis]
MTDTGAEVEEVPVLSMVEPMPGFPELREFHLERLDVEGILFALRSVVEPAIRLLVVPVHRFFPDYAPEISDETVAALGITPESEVITFGVVNPGESVTAATVNLLAPVVVDVSSGRAAQVVLDEDLPLRAPLFG